MREVIADIERWRGSNEPVALATVVETWGSAPRGVGAKLALTPSGRIVGSVSGGCVEGAVFESGVETLNTGRARLLSFGVADETAWEVGLACGGHIEVFVEPLIDDHLQIVSKWMAREESGAVATVIKGPDGYMGRKLYVTAGGSQQGTIHHDADDKIAALAKSALLTARSGSYSMHVAPHELVVFVDTILPAPALILVGGAHIAIALTTIARAVGFHTIVIDPRRAFGNIERFPHVDRLIQAWPDDAFKDVTITESTAVAMLTHDPKIDDPALKYVLLTPAFYIGALGSSATHAKRRRRLLDTGVAPQLVDRIHSPIGLDINAQTPEEIAVAVMAEIIAVSRKAERVQI